MGSECLAGRNPNLAGTRVPDYAADTRRARRAAKLDMRERERAIARELSARDKRGWRNFQSPSRKSWSRRQLPLFHPLLPAFMSLITGSEMHDDKWSERSPLPLAKMFAATRTTRHTTARLQIMRLCLAACFTDTPFSLALSLCLRRESL